MFILRIHCAESQAGVDVRYCAMSEGIAGSEYFPTRGGRGACGRTRSRYDRIVLRVELSDKGRS